MSRPKLAKLMNIVSKDGVNPLGAYYDFIMNDKVKNIDARRDYDKDPNNEFNLFQKQEMDKGRDNWCLGTTKSLRSKSVTNLIPIDKQEKYRFDRLPTDQFSYLPPNHPYEIKENRKNVQNGNTNSQPWSCMPNKFDNRLNKEGWGSFKADKDIFFNPIIDGYKPTRVQER